MAADVFELIVTNQEVASKVAPTVSEPVVVIVTGEGTSTIPSPPIMMPRMATLPCSPMTELVSSYKYKHLIFFSILLSLSL